MPLRSTYAQRKKFPPYALPYVSRLGPHSPCHANACVECPTYDVGGPQYSVYLPSIPIPVYPYQ
jgi:hypothetical protein